MTRMISYVLNPSKPCVSFCSVESPQWLWSLGIGSRVKSEESQSNASSIRESQSFYYIDVSPTHPWMFIHAEVHQVICCIHRVVRSKQIEIDVPRRRRNRRNLFAHVACTRARSCSMTQPCCAAKVGGVKGSNVQTVLWKTILKKHGFCEFIKKLMLPLCMHKAHSRVHVHRWLEHPLHSGTLGQSLVWLQWSRHCTWLSCLDWKLMETSETRKFSGPKVLWGLAGLRLTSEGKRLRHVTSDDFLDGYVRYVTVQWTNCVLWSPAENSSKLDLAIWCTWWSQATVSPRSEVGSTVTMLWTFHHINQYHWSHLLVRTLICRNHSVFLDMQWKGSAFWRAGKALTFSGRSLISRV